MYAQVCPVCEKHFFSDDKFLMPVPVLHQKCKFSNKKKRERPFRTSTPVSEVEENVSSFSDSVSEFFYQSWKNGLHSDLTLHDCPQSSTTPQLLCWSTPIVYVNNFIFQQFYPMVSVQPQVVGYRPDGTYGILPMNWFGVYR